MKDNFLLVIFSLYITGHFLLGSFFFFYFVLWIIFFSAPTFCLVFSNKVLILGSLPCLTYIYNYTYTCIYSNTNNFLFIIFKH